MQICNYHRVIPDVKGPAVGYVELWFSTVIRLGCGGSQNRLGARRQKIVTTGPKYMTVHIGNACIEMDIVVAHAPHSWGTKHQEGA